ncbi:hypothetical protein DIPPA_08447 [Diplonema papillatum]|nr:hypothetical protein DIPPA_08447 [Diplonema papillatum]
MWNDGSQGGETIRTDARASAGTVARRRAVEREDVEEALSLNFTLGLQRLWRQNLEYLTGVFHTETGTTWVVNIARGEATELEGRQNGVACLEAARRAKSAKKPGGIAILNTLRGPLKLSRTARSVVVPDVPVEATFDHPAEAQRFFECLKTCCQMLVYAPFLTPPPPAPPVGIVQLSGVVEDAPIRLSTERYHLDARCELRASRDPTETRKIWVGSIDLNHEMLPSRSDLSRWIPKGDIDLYVVGFVGVSVEKYPDPTRLINQVCRHVGKKIYTNTFSEWDRGEVLVAVLARNTVLTRVWGEATWKGSVVRDPEHSPTAAESLGGSPLQNNSAENIAAREPSPPACDAGAPANLSTHSIAEIQKVESTYTATSAGSPAAAESPTAGARPTSDGGTANSPDGAETESVAHSVKSGARKGKRVTLQPLKPDEGQGAAPQRGTKTEGIAVALRFDETTFCFVCTKVRAGTQFGRRAVRERTETLRRLLSQISFDGDELVDLPSRFHHTFVFGGLGDEILREVRDGHVMSQYYEGDLVLPSGASLSQRVFYSSLKHCEPNCLSYESLVPWGTVEEGRHAVTSIFEVPVVLTYLESLSTPSAIHKMEVTVRVTEQDIERELAKRGRAGALRAACAGLRCFLYAGFSVDDPAGGSFSKSEPAGSFSSQKAARPPLAARSAALSPAPPGPSGQRSFAATFPAVNSHTNSQFFLTQQHVMLSLQCDALDPDEGGFGSGTVALADTFASMWAAEADAGAGSGLEKRSPAVPFSVPLSARTERSAVTLEGSVSVITDATPLLALEGERRERDEKQRQVVVREWERTRPSIVEEEHDASQTLFAESRLLDGEAEARTQCTDGESAQFAAYKGWHAIFMRERTDRQELVDGLKFAVGLILIQATSVKRLVDLSVTKAAELREEEDLAFQQMSAACRGLVSGLGAFEAARRRVLDGEAAARKDLLLAEKAGHRRVVSWWTLGLLELHSQLSLFAEEAFRFAALRVAFAEPLARRVVEKEEFHDASWCLRCVEKTWRKNLLALELAGRTEVTDRRCRIEREEIERRAQLSRNATVEEFLAARARDRAFAREAEAVNWAAMGGWLRVCRAEDAAFAALTLAYDAESKKQVSDLLARFEYGERDAREALCEEWSDVIRCWMWEAVEKGERVELLVEEAARFQSAFRDDLHSEFLAARVKERVREDKEATERRHVWEFEADLREDLWLTQVEAFRRLRSSWNEDVEGIRAAHDKSTEVLGNRIIMSETFSRESIFAVETHRRRDVRERRFLELAEMDARNDVGVTNREFVTTCLAALESETRSELESQMGTALREMLEWTSGVLSVEAHCEREMTDTMEFIFLEQLSRAIIVVERERMMQQAVSDTANAGRGGIERSETMARLLREEAFQRGLVAEDERKSFETNVTDAVVFPRGAARDPFAAAPVTKMGFVLQKVKAGKQWTFAPRLAVLSGSSLSLYEEAKRFDLSYGCAAQKVALSPDGLTVSTAGHTGKNAVTLHAETPHARDLWISALASGTHGRPRNVGCQTAVTALGDSAGEDAGLTKKVLPSALDPFSPSPSPRSFGGGGAAPARPAPARRYDLSVPHDDDEPGGDFSSVVAALDERLASLQRELAPTEADLPSPRARAFSESEYRTHTYTSKDKEASADDERLKDIYESLTRLKHASADTTVLMLEKVEGDLADLRTSMRQADVERAFTSMNSDLTDVRRASETANRTLSSKLSQDMRELKQVDTESRIRAAWDELDHVRSATSQTTVALMARVEDEMKSLRQAAGKGKGDREFRAGYRASPRHPSPPGARGRSLSVKSRLEELAAQRLGGTRARGSRSASPVNWASPLTPSGAGGLHRHGAAPPDTSFATPRYRSSSVPPHSRPPAPRHSSLRQSVSFEGGDSASLYTPSRDRWLAPPDVVTEGSQTAVTRRAMEQMESELRILRDAAVSGRLLSAGDEAPEIVFERKESGLRVKRMMSSAAQTVVSSGEVGELEEIAEFAAAQDEKLAAVVEQVKDSVAYSVYCLLRSALGDPVGGPFPGQKMSPRSASLRRGPTRLPSPEDPTSAPYSLSPQSSAGPVYAARNIDLLPPPLSLPRTTSRPPVHHHSSVHSPNYHPSSSPSPRFVSALQPVFVTPPVQPKAAAGRALSESDVKLLTQAVQAARDEQVEAVVLGKDLGQRALELSRAHGTPALERLLTREVDRFLEETGAAMLLPNAAGARAERPRRQEAAAAAAGPYTPLEEALQREVAETAAVAERCQSDCVAARRRIAELEAELAGAARAGEAAARELREKNDSLAALANRVSDLEAALDAEKDARHAELSRAAADRSDHEAAAAAKSGECDRLRGQVDRLDSHRRDNHRLRAVVEDLEARGGDLEAKLREAPELEIENADLREENELLSAAMAELEEANHRLADAAADHADLLEENGLLSDAVQRLERENKTTGILLQDAVTRAGGDAHIVSECSRLAGENDALRSRLDDAERQAADESRAAGAAQRDVARQLDDLRYEFEGLRRPSDGGNSKGHEAAELRLRVLELEDENGQLKAAVENPNAASVLAATRVFREKLSAHRRELVGVKRAAEDSERARRRDVATLESQLADEIEQRACCMPEPPAAPGTVSFFEREIDALKTELAAARRQPPAPRSPSPLPGLPGGTVVRSRSLSARPRAGENREAEPRAHSLSARRRPAEHADAEAIPVPPEHAYRTAFCDDDTEAARLRRENSRLARDLRDAAATHQAVLRVAEARSGSPAPPPRFLADARGLRLQTAPTEPTEAAALKRVVEGLESELSVLKQTQKREEDAAPAREAAARLRVERLETENARLRAAGEQSGMREAELDTLREKLRRTEGDLEGARSLHSREAAALQDQLRRAEKARAHLEQAVVDLEARGAEAKAAALKAALDAPPATPPPPKKPLSGAEAAGRLLERELHRLRAENDLLRDRLARARTVNPQQQTIELGQRSEPPATHAGTLRDSEARHETLAADYRSLAAEKVRAVSALEAQCAAARADLAQVARDRDAWRTEALANIAAGTPRAGGDSWATTPHANTTPQGPRAGGGAAAPVTPPSFNGARDRDDAWRTEAPSDTPRAGGDRWATGSTTGGDAAKSAERAAADSQFLSKLLAHEQRTAKRAVEALQLEVAELADVLSTRQRDVVALKQDWLNLASQQPGPYAAAAGGIPAEEPGMRVFSRRESETNFSLSNATNSPRFPPSEVAGLGADTPRSGSACEARPGGHAVAGAVIKLLEKEIRSLQSENQRLSKAVGRQRTPAANGALLTPGLQKQQALGTPPSPFALSPSSALQKQLSGDVSVVEGDNARLREENARLKNEAERAVHSGQRSPFGLTPQEASFLEAENARLAAENRKLRAQADRSPASLSPHLLFLGDAAPAAGGRALFAPQKQLQLQQQQPLPPAAAAELPLLRSENARLTTENRRLERESVALRSQQQQQQQQQDRQPSPASPRDGTKLRMTVALLEEKVASLQFEAKQRGGSPRRAPSPHAGPEALRTSEEHGNSSLQAEMTFLKSKLARLEAERHTWNLPTAAGRTDNTLACEVLQTCEARTRVVLMDAQSEIRRALAMCAARGAAALAVSRSRQASTLVEAEHLARGALEGGWQGACSFAEAMRGTPDTASLAFRGREGIRSLLFEAEVDGRRAVGELEDTARSGVESLRGLGRQQDQAVLVGTVVRGNGLVTAKKLNERLGVVVDISKGRILVQFSGKLGAFALKEGNVRPLRQDPFTVDLLPPDLQHASQRCQLLAEEAACRRSLAVARLVSGGRPLAHHSRLPWSRIAFMLEQCYAEIRPLLAPR